MKKIEDTAEINLQFEKRGGVIPVIVTERRGGEVLMLGYTNAEAFRLTRETGMAHFYSTSRRELWKKGDTSGDLLKVSQIRVDCDQDALWYQVELVGDGVCHTMEPGEARHRKSCFYRRLEDDKWELT